MCTSNSTKLHSMKTPILLLTFAVSTIAVNAAVVVVPTTISTPAIADTWVWNVSGNDNGGHTALGFGAGASLLFRFAVPTGTATSAVLRLTFNVPYPGFQVGEVSMSAITGGSWSESSTYASFYGGSPTESPVATLNFLVNNDTLTFSGTEFTDLVNSRAGSTLDLHLFAGAGLRVAVNSREVNDQGLRPTLELGYVPEPSLSALAGFASVFFWRRRRRT
jgi:hypothetical protein